MFLPVFSTFILASAWLQKSPSDIRSAFVPIASTEVGDERNGDGF